MQSSYPKENASTFGGALPPDPPLAIDAEMQRLLDRANQALGRLDGITLLLPDADQFLYSYIRKEAVLSSQIEGTQSSLSDLLLFEHDVAPGVPEEDVRETTNYLAALNLGLKAMRRRDGPGRVSADSELARWARASPGSLRPAAPERGPVRHGRPRGGSALLVFDRAVREVVLRIPETAEQLPVSERRSPRRSASSSESASSAS